MTLAPGAFPNGSFYGLDAPLPYFGAQLATLHPVFVGVFDDAGGAATTLPLPPGLTLYGVALDLFVTLPPVAVSAPVAFVVP